MNLFRSRAVDAIVLEYHLGLLDGATVANAIKMTCPELPIVMLAHNVELPTERRAQDLSLEDEFTPGIWKAIRTGEINF